jgi:hypothetical protein
MLATHLFLLFYCKWGVKGWKKKPQRSQSLRMLREDRAGCDGCSRSSEMGRIPKSYPNPR